MAKNDLEGDINRETAREEVRGIRAVRLIVIFGIFCAVPLGIGVFFYARNTEESEFLTQFDEFARKVLGNIGSTFENSFGALDGLAVSLVASVESLNQTFPNFRVPRFSIRAAKALSLSKAKVLVTCPVVTDENLDSWTNWTAKEGRAWVDEALSVLETDGNFFGPIVEDYQTLDYIYSGEGPVPRKPGRVYLPSWQAYPIVPSWPPYNFGYIATLTYTTAHLEMLEKGTIIITNPYLNPDPEDSEAMKEAEANADWLSQRLHPDEEPLEPASDLYFPIRNNLVSVETDSKAFPPVATFAVTFYWRDMIRDILPESAIGILVVVENPCSAAFTYKLDGHTPVLLGRGDLHDAKYDGLVVESRMTELKTYRLRESTYTGPKLDTEHCPITFKVYPSTETENAYKTKDPIVFSISTALICLFASVIFLIYDRFQEHRQKAVIEKAKRSDAVVSSFFPEGVRSRVYERSQGLTNNGPAIADLYTHTTVLFADMCGFTAWSSTRDASDVFTLLESIYLEFDILARSLEVFKVETVADAYVAIAGLPEPREDHAVVMAEFAAACRAKMVDVVKRLATTLGPGTESLRMRYGLNSGPITGGVLRGDKSRFQIFGDTANVAARLESTSIPDRIHVSQKTADLLIEAGKDSWVKKRTDAVVAKGKGNMTTFWVNPISMHESSATEDALSEHPYTTGNSKLRYLINFNVEVLQNLLKDLMLNNQMIGSASWRSIPTLPKNGQKDAFDEKVPRDQVVELIPIPRHEKKQSVKPSSIELSDEVKRQLHDLVQVLAYRHNNENPFHNFHHAVHVAMSVRKLLARILKPLQKNGTSKMDRILQSTYALTSDPLIQFAVYFSALIHDAEHPGVSNSTLSKEGDHRAIKFEHKSSAEQNSVVVAWDLLMSKDYDALRACMFSSVEQMELFRQIVVNAVMATDIFDGELKAIRESRWSKAFPNDDASPVQSFSENLNLEGDLRATIVIEHVIQASDVVHTMQHWTVYQHWNRRLFAEMRGAYSAGRTDKDPAESWYRGELWFFDNYVIPLAKKLKECGVFGVSCDEVLDYAIDNRMEWEQKGAAIVSRWVEQEEGQSEKNSMYSVLLESELTLKCEEDGLGEATVEV